MSPTPEEIRKAKITLWRWGIGLVVVLVLAGFLAYGAWFSPASKPGAETAFNACELAMIRDEPNAVLPASSGDVTYSGSEAEWTITGTYHLLGTTTDGQPFPDTAFTCTATKDASGGYTVTWENQ